MKVCCICEFCKDYGELYYCKLYGVEVKGDDYCENWECKNKENKK